MAAGHSGRELGNSLTSGDFDGDGYADVAAGAYWSDGPGPEERSRGGVAVVYGGPSGLSLDRHAWFVHDSPGIPSTPEADHRGFGIEVVAADFTGDGRADLAVAERGPVLDAPGGAVAVLKGSSAGLTSAGAQWWHQDSPGVPDWNEPADAFGRSLAAADFDGDGRADLAIGNAAESIGTDSSAGTVTVLRGAAGGLTATGAQLWDRADAGVPGTIAAGAYFGDILEAGDLNADGVPDLVVTARDTAGSVTWLPGIRGTGLTGAGSVRIDQATADVPGTPEQGDRFGAALLVLPAASGRPAHLVVGVPGEDIATVPGGTVAVLPGTGAGPSGTGSVPFDGTGVPGDGLRDFGTALG
ncbi:FG-GAP-like repeat-containing protein [Spirilliplanes yamanashiensis]|uniref:FG-GAP repeat protein n=1 Tax=Spirilliplanes yamanashiensis TaxID=42233 RepID=A0A8J4DIX1_9ACTN|nr:FG-GAP-like repeat-containing protein [Spirilliplanes yamanashiensis]MDP9814747.1 hypothetical protein [Spirilliplanes yamanashiensis]GIJ02400.1 hypothetical protein Sya03_17520 [Spirilliplanes yamanashiensis]